MTSENLTPKELHARKVEFLKKLKELLEDYVAVIGYNYGRCSKNPDCFSIVTDGHIRTSWENETILEELDEDHIDFWIEQSNED